MPEPGECARARIARGAVPPGIALVAVAAALRVTRAGVTVRLLAEDGAILDHLWCPPRAAPYDLAVFGDARAAVLRLGHAAPDSAATLLAARVLGFSGDSLDPARLLPQRDPAVAADWPRDPYGEPTAEDAAGRLRNLVVERLAQPVTVPWLGDLRLRLEPGDEQSRCLMKSGLYEPEGLHVVGRRLAAGGVFVDVGANCGLYTLFAARAVGRAGRVVAFEPSPREFRRLRDAVALNGFTQVALHQAAVSDAPGVVTLRIAEPGFAGHNTMAERFAYDRVVAAEVASVPAVTLDAALAALPRLDMIKLDIEGAELRALRGAAATLARLRPALLLEVYEDALAGNGATVRDLVGWLDAQGYRLHDIDPRTGAVRAGARFPAGVNKNVLALPRRARP
jgi:FkbM family methyltransferase